MRADNTISIIGKIKEAASQLIVRELEARGHYGLVASHGEIIYVLIFRGEMTKTDISLSINRERSTVTTLIKKLESLGYIRSRANHEDARSTLVSLTEKGKDMEKAFIEISELLYDTQYLGMTKKEIEQFRACLIKMNGNFTQLNK